MPHVPSPDRYDAMQYRRCGRSGLKLPAVSLGLWHNFGHDRRLHDQRGIVRRAFDQSLTRMGLDYVDIFYSHRFDPETPLEETMGALDTAVRQGKALYVGVSSYSAQSTAEAAAILRELGTPLLIHQPSYSLLNRWIEG